MTGDLREQLDDLLADVPAHVPVDAVAARRAGSRLRARRRLTAAGATVAVLALVGGVGLAAHRAGEAPPADQPHGSGAGSYPTRVDRPVWPRSMPDSPGPLAGVLQRDGGWSGVSRSGQVWRIVGAGAQWTPALSPDGLQLAYMNTRYGMQSYDLVHLADGSATELGPGGPRPSVHSAFVVQPASQSFWSPDSTRLLVPVRNGIQTSPHAVALVVGLDGHTTVVRSRPYPGAMPAGWVSSTELGWVGSRRTHVGRPPLLLYVTSVHGGAPVRTVTLRAATQGGTVSASLSPSGQALSLTSTIHQYEFGPTGLLVGQIPLPTGSVVGCPVSWSQSEPWLPTGAGAASDAALVSQSGSVLIQADPALHVGCSVWAQSALDGSAHRGVSGWLFGTSDSWLSWHWRQVALGSVLGLGTLLAAGWVVVRRRRRRALTATAEPATKPA